MKSRPLRPEDVPILEQQARESGYPYPDLSDRLIEAVEVITDDEDKPIAACIGKRLVELYLLFDPASKAALRIEALNILHESMAKRLKALGYDCAETFLPPNVERRFWRTLRDRWGWYRNWNSFGRRF